jgi:hypothetical protein
MKPDIIFTSGVIVDFRLEMQDKLLLTLTLRGNWVASHTVPQYELSQHELLCYVHWNAATYRFRGFIIGTGASASVVSPIVTIVQFQVNTSMERVADTPPDSWAEFIPGPRYSMPDPPTCSGEVESNDGDANRVKFLLWELGIKEQGGE